MPQPEDLRAGYEQELEYAETKGDKERAGAIRKALAAEAPAAGIDFVSSSHEDTEVELPQADGSTKRVKQATVVEKAAVRNTQAPKPVTGPREA